MADRFQKLPNGDIYDSSAKRIIKKSDGKVMRPVPPGTKPGKPDTAPPLKKKDSAAEKEEKKREKTAHARIAMEIRKLNEENPQDKSNPQWLGERGEWYFNRCIEEGCTPTPQGLVTAWGFKSREEKLLMSGNSGLNAECRDVIAEFKQYLEMVAEGGLVDTTSGVVGKIFDLKNRFGWTDTGNLQIESAPKLGEIASAEALKKAIAQMPGLDLIDEPIEVVDVEFEVVE